MLARMHQRLNTGRNSVPSSSSPSLFTSSNAQLRRLVPLIVGVGVALFLITQVLLNQAQSSTALATASQPETFTHTHTDTHTHYITEAATHTSVPGTAFAFLALGAQANQMNCAAAIESLVRHSGWGGDVYLLTDQERCFDKDTVARNAGMKKENLHYVVIDESFSTGGIDLTHPRIGFRKARVRSFAMKTRLFEFITDPQIHTVAFTDCDILFSTPGCAQEFATAGPSWEDVSIKFSRLFYDTDSGDLRDIHAGTFVVHREHSRALLRQWREAIEAGQQEGDNDAYMHLYHSINAAQGNTVLFDRKKAESLREELTASVVDSTQPRHLRASNTMQETSSLSLNHTHHTVSSNTQKTSVISNNARFDAFPHLSGKNTLLPGEILKPDYLQDKAYRGYESHVVGSAVPWSERYRFEKFFHPTATTPVPATKKTGDTQGEAAPGSGRVHHVEQICMNHVSKARCSAFGREAVQQYVDRYRLRTYSYTDRYTGEERQHKYCVSPALQTLLYGWFPFGYLPWCPKIETYL